MENLAAALPPRSTKPEDPTPMSPVAANAFVPLVFLQQDKKDDDEDEEADEDEKKKKKEKEKEKAKASDDSDGDQVDALNANTRAIRQRERNRIGAILESDAGRANLRAAYHFAMKTDLPREQAIAMLLAVGPQASAPVEQLKHDLRSRMAEVPQPIIGASDPGKPEGESISPWVATPARMAAAIAKARGL
jgi:hypothetical protein